MRTSKKRGFKEIECKQLMFEQKKLNELFPIGYATTVKEVKLVVISNKYDPYLDIYFEEIENYRNMPNTLFINNITFRKSRHVMFDIGMEHHASYERISMDIFPKLLSTNDQILLRYPGIVKSFNVTIDHLTKNGFVIKEDVKEFGPGYKMNGMDLLQTNRKQFQVIDSNVNGYRFSKCSKPEERFDFYHVTGSLDKILESQFLMSDSDLHFKLAKSKSGLTMNKETFEADNWCGDQFPGVYFRVNFGQFSKYVNMWNDPDFTNVDINDKVYLQVSGELIKRGDFHFNPLDSDGRILGTFSDLNNYPGQRTYFADEFDSKVRNNHKYYNRNSTPKNEIIFHHKVPIQCIQIIYVATRTMYDYTMSLLNENKIQWIDVRLGVPNQINKRPLFMNVKPLEPNYCSCLSQIPYWADEKDRSNILLYNSDVNNRIIQSCVSNNREIKSLVPIVAQLQSIDSNSRKNHIKNTKANESLERLYGGLESTYQEINDIFHEEMVDNESETEEEIDISSDDLILMH